MDIDGKGGESDGWLHPSRESHEVSFTRKAVEVG